MGIYIYIYYIYIFTYVCVSFSVSLTFSLNKFEYTCTYLLGCACVRLRMCAHLCLHAMSVSLGVQVGSIYDAQKIR